VGEGPAPPELEKAAVAEFSHVSSVERMTAVAEALERNGIRALLARSGEEARQIVTSLLPPGAEVFNNTSRTLEGIGVADDIERSGRYEPLRVRLFQMDREMQTREMRILCASPDYVIGSVHAVTESGSLVVASASGSQLGPIASGAEHVIFVIGGQKIVADLQTAIRRIVQHSFTLEDRRGREHTAFRAE
jgi:hypothetical protein